MSRNFFRFIHQLKFYFTRVPFSETHSPTLSLSHSLSLFPSLSHFLYLSLSPLCKSVCLSLSLSLCLFYTISFKNVRRSFCANFFYQKQFCINRSTDPQVCEWQNHLRSPDFETHFSTDATEPVKFFGEIFFCVKICSDIATSIVKPIEKFSIISFC